MVVGNLFRPRRVFPWSHRRYASSSMDSSLDKYYTGHSGLTMRQEPIEDCFQRSTLDLLMNHSLHEYEYPLLSDLYS